MSDIDDFEEEYPMDGSEVANLAAVRKAQQSTLT